MIWSRREAVLGGNLWLLSAPLFGCPCGAAEPRHNPLLGCTLSDAEAETILSETPDTRLYITGNEPMIPRSGDKDFDLALAHTLAKLADMFGVAPGFAYYDDYDAVNAYATPKVRLNGADGTVLFGQRMLQRLMSGKESPDVCVAAVCAHEFGHILQYKKNLLAVVGAGQPTVKRIELQADFFAGYFAGVRKRQLPNFPAAVFAMTQFNFGDNQINHQGHHGTPDQRASAIVKGFEAAYVQKANFNDAIQASINYVKQI